VVSIVRQLKSALGFLTVIPVDGDYSLRDAARGAWLFPAVGLILGLISGLLGQFLSLAVPWSIASAVSLLALLLLTGFQHLDGLLDFGDALLVRGGHAQRRRVMHSPGIGAGAFGLGAMVILITYLALSQSQNLIKALVLAESSAKLAMLLTAFFGSPAWQGMGRDFILVLRREPGILLLGFILYLLIAAPLAAMKMPFIILGVFVLSLLMARFSKTLIGGLSGDALGATNEITRMLVLVVLL
jgi:adenosylcobinamide-GDP ribazoletransferase